MAKSEKEKILKEENNYLYTDSESGIGKKSKDKRVMDENTGNMRRETIGPQQVWYTDEDGNSKFKRVRGDDQKNEWQHRLGKFADDAGARTYKSISNAIPDIEEDDSGFTKVMKGLGKMGANVVGGVAGSFVQATGNIPKFVSDIVDSAYYDDVQWGWNNVTESYNKHYEQNKQEGDGTKENIINSVTSAVSALEENNNDQSISAEGINQLINGPLGMAVGKLIKIGGNGLRRLTKSDDALKGVTNIADDGVKLINNTDEVLDSTKIFSKTDDLVKGGTKPFSLTNNAAKEGSLVDDLLKLGSKADDAAKTTSKSTNILERVANSKAWQVVNKVKNSKAGQVVSKLTEGTGQFLLGPFWDAGRVIGKSVNAAFKSTGVGKGVAKGITEIMAGTLDHAGNFLSKPLSYRTPKIWEAETSNVFLGGISEALEQDIDSKEFREEHGYNIEDVDMLNEEKLEEYYNNNDIPEDKRLTAEQIAQEKEKLGDNFISDVTETRSKGLQLFDVFSTPARMQELQAGGDLEIEKNSRGETIGIYKTDGGLSVDFDKGIITDEDGNEVNDFTDEQFEELKDLFTEVLGEDIISQGEGEVEGEGSQGPIPTGDDDEEENNLLDSINGWATNGMITSEVAQSVVTGVNTKSHPTYIVDRMNEASKAYTNKIINMYTADAIKNDVKLQREIYNKLNLFNKIINGVPEVINNIDSEEYKSDVIEFRKALSASYEKNLTDKEKALFNENLYQASIDYNNDLEEGAERALMETATFMKRAGDNILSMIKSDDREFWYDQGLSSFGNELINPDTKGWTSGFRNVSNSLESNGSYLLNMWLLNKLNDRVVENYTSKGLDKIIKNNPKLNTKRGAYFKGSATEMASEPLENLLDHISLVDSSETGDEYWQGLLFGMFQGGLAGYASSTNSYTSFNDYMSRPENRTEVLQRMGIYIDQIKDPQQRAAALEITGKMFDNVAGIMKDVAGKTNNGVETIMQGYAIYQVENMIADYTTDLIGQAIDELNHVGEWTSEKIQYYFGTDQDTTGIKNFKNYNDGKNFNFSNTFMDSIKNKQENVEKFNNIYNIAQAYIQSSFKTANMTLEEGINTMAPKVYESTGGKVITPIFGKKIVDTEIVNDITGNPISDIVTIFAGTNQIAPIIGDLTGISKDNPLVYGEKKNIFGKKTKGYKNKITVNQYDNNGKKIGEKTYTMRDYIVEEVLNGENALNKEQKRFIATILFRTSVSGYNSYFNADGSLTRLGEDFFEQVMPKLNDTGATTRFFKKMAQLQTFKEAEADKSERDAIKESGAGKKVYSGIVIEGHRFNNGDDVTNVSDEVRLPVEKDGVQVKMGDLKNGQTVAVYDEKSEKVYSMSVDNEGKLHINEETNEQTEVPFEEEDKPEKIGTIDWMRIKRLGYNHKTLGELEEELNYLEQEHKERQRQRAIAKKEKKTLDFNYEQIVGQINSKTQLLKSYIKFLKENPDYQPKKESTYKVMPGGITEVVVEENSQEDRNCTVPVSVSAEDHPSLEGKFVDAKELLAAWNEEKSYIPYMAQYEMTVPLDLPNGINNLHPEGGKEEIYYLPNDHFTKKENLEKQSIVTIYRHDGTTKEYRLIWINDHEVKDYNGRMEGLDRADRFKSFILVDAKNGETAEKITTNTIRPFAYNPQGEKIDKAYYDNNIAYIIRDKNGNEINENRVIVMYHKTGKVVKWQMSTTIQVDRMNEKDINNAFKSNRVFMNEPSSSTSTQRHGWLGNEEVTYDARPIFTTSDIIFNKDNDMIDFGQGITVDISGRSYEKPFTYEGRKADQKTIQDIFNTLWKKGQKIQRDGSIVGEESNEPEVTTDEKLTMAVEEMQAPEEESQPVQTITKTSTEVAKGVTKIIKQQNDNVEMVIEEAKDTPAPATESIAETVVNEQNKNAPVLLFEGELQTPELISQNKYPIKKIISGGQSGADRVGLEIARHLGIPTGGTAPKGYRTEAKTEEGIKANIEALKGFGLVEDESSDYKSRTRKNIIDSDGTIIIASNIDSAGTKLTINTANELGKPLFIIKENTSPEEIQDWIAINNIQTLNVAGNRSSVAKKGSIKLLSGKLLEALEGWHNYVGYMESISDNDDIKEQESTVLDYTNVLALPSPTELVADNSIPNEKVASRLLADDTRIKQLVSDCEKLGIVLESLDARELGIVIQAYRDGLGIDYVIEQFTDKLLTSQVDKKLVDIFIKKGILRSDVTYDGLSIQEMINYTAMINHVKIGNLKKMVDPTLINEKTGWMFMGDITDYYIRNYFHLNPKQVSSYFRNKIKKMVSDKLLESDIYIAQKGNDTLNVGDEMGAILELESLDDELKKDFATAAFEANLISQSRYNYLMGINPYIANVNNGEYNPGIIASAVLKSINEIAEFGQITSETANKNKLTLLMDVYNYFSISRTGDYNGLIRYLKKKYKKGSKEMKSMISILEQDKDKSLNPIHSDEVMKVLKSPVTTYEGSNYENFVKDKFDNTDAIVEALIALEKQDQNSFMSIMVSAPGKIKTQIYNKFYADNKLNHGSNIAYGLVGSILPNDKEVMKNLKREYAKVDTNNMSSDAIYLLRNFDRRSLINPIVTQQLYQEFGIRGLDLNKGTVILTNNGQDSKGKGMTNFNNVKSFPMLSVGSLADLKLDVNVIVPYGISVPENLKGRFNIIRMPQAGYHNGALVVRTYDGNNYNLEQRVYNLFGLSGMGISYEDFKLSKEAWNLIKESKNSNELYWNIFKYNILPNLGDEFQDISQEYFEKKLDSSKFEKVNTKTLFNAFAAKDINSMINASISIINKVTNYRLGIKSSSYKGRQGLDINTSINQFSLFVANTFSNSYDREVILKMYSEFIMAQLKKGDFDKGARFHDFCENHAYALSLLNKVYKDRGQRGAGLSSIFINNGLSDEIPVDEEIDMSKIIANEGDLKAISEYNTKIKALRKTAAKKEQEWNSRKGIADTIEDIKERNKYREETGRIYREWQRILSDIDNLKEYRDDMIVAIETSDQESMQEQKIDIEQKENNTIVTQSFETKGSYEDNAIKVLSAIFNDYIDNNTMNIGDSTLSDLTGLKIVSKGLLGTISGADTFENKPQGDLELNGLNTEYSENRRNDISSKDLMSLQSMLMTLKETNPGKLKTILDSIIVTQENIGFEYYNNDEKNEKLKRVKEELFKYPVRFYSIMEELLSDPDLGVDVYYNVGFEKATGFKKVQVKGLLNSISQEYYDSKPVPMDSKTVVTLHEQFDKYFDIRDKDGKELKPSDEQIYAFWLLKNGFDNRTAGGVIPIAGIAGTGKTTLITALFNYINEAGGAAQDVTNISTGKQKVLVHNFEKKGVVFKKGSPDKRYTKDHKEMLWGIKKDKSDGYHYIKVENKESGAGVYIKFKKGGISTQSELDSKYKSNPEGFIEEKSKALAGIYNNDAVKALYEVGGDNYKSDFSQFTFEISDFEVEDESKIPDDAEIMVVSGRQGYVRQRKGQNFNGLEGVQTFKNQKGEDVVSIGNNAEGLNNVSFAVRMHSTVGSLKDVFVNKGGLDGLDIATIDSYLVQDNPTLMNDIGYSTSYSIRPPKQSEGRIIIIDETQNSYNTHLKALVDGLSKNNVIVFLGDYHQMSKGDYLAKQENTFYMVDTHRGTEDINLINEISSFSQKALTKANAIGIYMSDSEDFVKYNPEDISSLVDGSIKKTLMVCSRNENRKKANDTYLQELGGTDEIIKKGGTIQAMIVDIESNKSSQRNRKSELPDEGLNMKGFIKSTYGNYYYRYNGDNIDLFFPSTVKTDKSDHEIEKALNTVRNWKNRKGYKYGQHDKEEVKAEIAIYVPAFAITTEKESGKTVDNIILHEDITNTEYDYLSEQNVKQYYDAFTRGSKKVYIPNNSTRLIGITKEQATKLREGQGLTSAVINTERDEVDTDSMNVPSINNGRWNNSYVVDKMYSFLDMFKKLKLDGTKEAKNELIKMQTIMTQYYLQGRMTTADAEVLTKFGNAYGFDIDNIPSGYVGIVRPGLLYQKQLQYHIAEIWDSLYSKIDKRKLHEYISKLDNAKEVFDNLQFINGKIYGQTIKTPHVTSNQNELLYGQKKYINKKIDLELMNQVQMQEDLIGEGSYLEGRLLKPVTRQGKDGKFYTMLQDVKVEWETTNKKGWLDYIIDGEKAAKEYEDMVRRIDARLDINTYDGNEKLLFEAVYKELESTYQDIEDNDLVGVRDYIASSAAEDVFEDSALQIMYDSIENLAQNENANDIEELKNMLISLNGYIIGYKNGQTLGEIEKELHGEPVQFNESSALNTANKEFTCNG